jgi:hypothetical protein
MEQIATSHLATPPNVLVLTAAVTHKPSQTPY